MQHVCNSLTANPDDTLSDFKLVNKKNDLAHLYDLNFIIPQ